MLVNEQCEACSAKNNAEDLRQHVERMDDLYKFKCKMPLCKNRLQPTIFVRLGNVRIK